MKKKMICLICIFTLLIIVQDQINKSSSKEDVKEEVPYSDNVKIVGHRGFSSVKVQNSLESMMLADESKYVDEIELDVRITSDNVLVLSHDEGFLTKYKKHNTISNMTSLSFLQSNFIDKNRLYYKIKSKYAKLNAVKNMSIDKKYVGTTTTLNEVLDKITDKDIIIDIKYNNNMNMMNYLLLNAVKGHKNVILQSDNIDGIDDLISRDNTYRYQVIIDDWNDYKRLNKNYYSIAANYSYIDYAICKKLISDGYEVYVWTVNDEPTYGFLRDRFKEYANDVHYITDFPNVLATYRNN